MAKFILSKDKVKEQYDLLRELGAKVSYSCKTNWDVVKILEEDTDCDFSVHNVNELGRLKDKGKVWFFPQALDFNKFAEVLSKDVRHFVIDNESDLMGLLEVVNELRIKVDISLRMKFQEHRIGSGRYFVYGLPSRRVNELIDFLSREEFVDKIGVHIHRKSQNTSEWEIVKEIKESLTEESLKEISTLNIGGGLPVRYKTYSSEVLPYIFDKIKEAREFLSGLDIEMYVEPGRFIAAPAVKLEAEIIQVYDRVVVIDCSVYNAAINTVIEFLII